MYPHLAYLGLDTLEFRKGSAITEVCSFRWRWNVKLACWLTGSNVVSIVAGLWCNVIVLW